MAVLQASQLDQVVVRLFVICYLYIYSYNTKDPYLLETTVNLTVQVQ